MHDHFILYIHITLLENHRYIYIYLSSKIIYFIFFTQRSAMYLVILNLYIIYTT